MRLLHRPGRMVVGDCSELVKVENCAEEKKGGKMISCQFLKMGSDKRRISTTFALGKLENMKGRQW